MMKRMPDKVAVNKSPGQIPNGGAPGLVVATSDVPPKPAVPAAPKVRLPTFRRLQVYALDPGAENNLDTAHFSRCILSVPWEGHPNGCQVERDAEALPACCSGGTQVPNLDPGPVGEYIEVVDDDPSSNCVYEPVDLNNSLLLASDGLAPSIGNPQFHQQMVYAIAMKTIANFERVLGRRILWAERERDEHGFLTPEKRYVRRLRIYPHALREQNAYYSPAKKALLFGYFNATTDDPREELPGGVVFTCLSHDIVAHETTHAILDGLHRRLMDATNIDMLAFHEGFADIVAIFQHFTLEGMLYDQIQHTRGDLRTNTRLAELAAQFGHATNRGGALRNALGLNSDGRQAAPDPALLNRTFEPHKRGAILVSAVFDAFLSMYERRVADLYRIATGGTGELPKGNIHPDLARRLATAASKTAQRVLEVCIRAIDYLPPIDVTFGDYLRALITADSDRHPEDPSKLRLAFIDGFRNRGIYPRDVRAIGEDSLRWTHFCDNPSAALGDLLLQPHLQRAIVNAFDVVTPFEAEHGEKLTGSQENLDEYLKTMSNKFFRTLVEKPESSGFEPRRQLFLLNRHCAVFLRNWLFGKVMQHQADAAFRRELHEQLGLDAEGMSSGAAPLEVHSVRPTVRTRPDGRTKLELLVKLTQSRRMILLDESGAPMTEGGETLKFKIRGGCTLLIDPETGCVSYAIKKRIPTQRQIDERSSGRLARQMDFIRSLLAMDRQAAINRFSLTPAAFAHRTSLEPFAVVHRHESKSEGY